MEDFEHILVAKNEANNQLDKSIGVIKRYEKQIAELQNHADIMEKEKHYAEQREQKSRDIMVQNITDSNLKVQNYLGEIQELKGIIKQLKAQSKEVKE